MKNSPIIIVGFGIAGATMAWQLYLKKIPFLIIAEPTNTCSRAAAGMINPIVFQTVKHELEGYGLVTKR